MGSKMQQHSQSLLPYKDKYGVAVYRTNPSLPIESELKKSRRTKLGDEKQGMIVDSGTGEILGAGGAISYKWEEVDKERFVKLYLDGIKQAVGLSKAGLSVFELVYNQLQENHGKDQVQLSVDEVPLAKATYFRGVRELIDKEFLFKSPYDGVFFVNIRFMFNGDRLAFVKAYKLKDAAPQQIELMLE
jgi:hypothetical protein